MMKKILIVFTLLLFYSPALVLAQTATGSAIRNAVQEKVVAELANIKKTLTKKGFVGNVTAKTASGFTLTNLKNQPRNVTVPGDAVLRSANKDITLADIKVNDFVIAMGDADTNNDMTAKRVLVTTKSEEDKRRSFIFVITKTSTSSLAVENLKKETQSVRISSDTNYTTKTKLADLKVGDKIAVIGTLASTPSTINALKIHKLTK